MTLASILVFMGSERRNLTDLNVDDSRLQVLILGSLLKSFRAFRHVITFRKRRVNLMCVSGNITFELRNFTVEQYRGEQWQLDRHVGGRKQLSQTSLM